MVKNYHQNLSKPQPSNFFIRINTKNFTVSREALSVECFFSNEINFLHHALALNILSDKKKFYIWATVTISKKKLIQLFQFIVFIYFIELCVYLMTLNNQHKTNKIPLYLHTHIWWSRARELQVFFLLWLLILIPLILLLHCLPFFHRFFIIGRLRISEMMFPFWRLHIYT